jgi:NADH dehydrogenase
MKTLVTGGTGLVGAETVRRLLAKGHSVRLFTRHAKRDVENFSGDIEPREGSVTSEQDVKGIAEGCDTILHIAGAVRETSDDTLRGINVAGTQLLLDEAERAGVPRFVYVSSLGADTGTSDYHQSKIEAETLVRTFRRDWLICRPGGVYGPGDDTISVILGLLERSPAVPMLNFGSQEFQPIWHEDCAEAIAVATERPDMRSQVLLMAGPEVTTMQDVLKRLSTRLGKTAVGVPIFEPIAELGAKAMGMLGIESPVAPDQMRMVVEGNVLPPGGINAVTETLGLKPIGLDEGLDRLIRSRPSQQEGVGEKTAHRFAVRIAEGKCNAEELFQSLADNFGQVFEGTPVSGTGLGDGKLEEGNTLGLELPAQRMVSVRVVERGPCSATCETLEGHVLSGTVSFQAKDEPEAILFEVRTHDAPSSAVDAVLMNSVGRAVQASTWRQVLENVVRMSGGRAIETVVDGQQAA